MNIILCSEWFDDGFFFICSKTIAHLPIKIYTLVLEMCMYTNYIVFETNIIIQLLAVGESVQFTAMSAFSIKN